MRRRSGSWLLLAGSAASIFTLLVIVLLAPSVPRGQSIEEQLAELASSSALYQWTFVSASLISVPYVAMMVLLAFFAPLPREPGMLDLIGVLFLAPYTVLVSLAYTSQYVLLPRLLDDIDGVGLTAAKAWYFVNPNSVVLFIDMLGYMFWSIGAFAIGFKFLTERGLARIVGWTMWGTGLAAIVGFAGMAIQNSMLEMGVLISLFGSLVLTVLVAYWGAKLHQGKDGRIAPER